MKKIITLGLLVAGLAAVAGGIHWTRRAGAHQGGEPAARNDAANEPRAVSALGRLEPEGGLIRLAAPGQIDGARVARLLVREGESVRAGQLVATLDLETTREAQLQEAQQQVRIAQARLDQVRAPARVGEIEAQRATLDRLQAELRQAENEYRRHLSLLETGDVPQLRVDARRLAVETLRAELARARAQHAVLREYRPVDAQVAEAELAQMRAQAARLEIELAQTRIRAPIDGEVFKLHARAGETIGAKGILEIGRTSQMFAIAEVFESDVARVRAGARAAIRARAIEDELRGTVELIGLQVGRKELIGSDPAVDAEARVVEVKIRLDAPSGKRAARLTNTRVEVRIEP